MIFFSFFTGEFNTSVVVSGKRYFRIDKRKKSFRNGLWQLRRSNMCLLCLSLKICIRSCLWTLNKFHDLTMERPYSCHKFQCRISHIWALEQLSALKRKKYNVLKVEIRKISRLLRSRSLILLSYSLITVNAPGRCNPLSWYVWD